MSVEDVSTTLLQAICNMVRSTLPVFVGSWCRMRTVSHSRFSVAQAGLSMFWSSGAPFVKTKEFVPATADSANAVSLLSFFLFSLLSLGVLHCRLFSVLPFALVAAGAQQPLFFHLASHM